MNFIDEEAVNRLADDCRYENAQFQREGKSNPIPCFELLRLAFAEENSFGLNHVYAIYLPKLEGWAFRYMSNRDIGEDAEFIASEVFINFYWAALGEKFDQKFKTLPQIIRFMQVCVKHMIDGHRRKPDPPGPLPEPDVADPRPISEDGEFDELWKRICELLPNPHHQLLARLVFILAMKPREIIEIEEYRLIWQTEHNVSQTLYRIRLVLRSDDRLRKWMDDDPPEN